MVDSVAQDARGAADARDREEDSRAAGASWDTHPLGYVRRDWRVVDYAPYRLVDRSGRKTDHWLRGPEPAQGGGDYIACVGAAQTFGCFVADPWPALLGRALDLPALNLGVGGAGPRWFLRHPELIDAINGARFAVVQVMSGRSTDNSVFESGGREQLTRRSSGRRTGADASWVELLREEAWFSARFAGRTFHLGARTRRMRALVAETRRNWTAETIELLRAIEVPKVMLWLSRRAPGYISSYATLGTLFRQFPQLVDGRMLRRVAAHADALVTTVSRRGSPQPLYDRFTGQPTTISLSVNRSDFHGSWSKNMYYPSPEMHEDAARRLLPVCRGLLEGGCG